VCNGTVEQTKIRKLGLVIVSPPAATSAGHTNRAGTIAVCKILGLDYKLVPSKVREQHWVCVTPEVEATLRAVNEVAHSAMLVIPEAARRLADKRDLLIEFDAQRRLGADDDVLFDFLALAGIMGARAQFEARCTQRNPNRSDLSIRRSWEKFWRKQRRRARERKQ
jgi:hypothetical protein